MMRVLCLMAALIASDLAHAQSLDAQTRAARDAQRLAATTRAHQADTARDDARSERRALQRRALRTTQQRLVEIQASNEALDARVALLDDDLAQLHAVNASTLQSQRARVKRGPLAADRTDLIDSIDALARRPASLDVFYDTWFLLHEEWLAGGEVTFPEEALTLASGVRRSTRLTRFGSIALGHRDHRVIVSPDAGLLEQAQARSSGANADYLRQQVYDSGAIGIALLLCALAAAVALLRRQDPGLVSLIASASLLLGLLGTVVGLIHTFRALARYGGADASVAAAGISHALATTWMGLVIAIALMLLGPAVARLPARASVQRALALTPRWRLPLVARSATAFGIALAFACALFFLMQWLTQRPLSPPPATQAPVQIERIDVSTPPPPPPPPSATVVSVADAAPSAPSFELPAASPLSAPTPGVTAPALNIEPGLSGLGDGGLPAAGTLWSGASAGSGITDGSDLVPISSARPRYPRAALEAGIDGWVEAIFRIDASGRVSDVRIIDAEPPGVFEQAAAQALERWLYAPFYQGGRPVAREATQLLRFRHREARDTYLEDDQ